MIEPVFSEESRKAEMKISDSLQKQIHSIVDQVFETFTDVAKKEEIPIPFPAMFMGIITGVILLNQELGEAFMNQHNSTQRKDLQ